MNRNTESRFAYNPQISIHRSRFDRNSSHKTTFNVGELIPFYVDEVLPGDTFDVTSSKVVRLQTLLTPMMDNLYLDFYWFFVPNRLVWDHWREMNGENTSGYWTQSVEYNVPQASVVDTIPYSGVGIGSVADYMGIPICDNDSGLSVNVLPFRAYGLIYNEFFRDQNLIEPDLLDTGDTVTYLVGNSPDFTTYPKIRTYTGYPYLVAKYHDYFTSCLPSPQKGPDVFAPGKSSDWAPVVTGESHDVNGISLNWVDNLGDPLTAARRLVATSDGTRIEASTTPNVGNLTYEPDNLYAALSNIDIGLNINDLRLAFQVQKLYEKDARGGTRYIELLKSHFGVTSPDARLQRPEYLGGNRVPININQVIQSNQSDDTPLGHTAAMSVTSDIHSDFTKSFVEHGFVIGLCVARYDHTYQQGIERFWSRKDRFDYYWPVFANIGEQAVLNKEIYFSGTSSDDEVFGYNEAWADYRYKPSRVSGEMRSDAPLSLDSWHLADYYAAKPELSQDWIQEDGSIVDRVLAVTSSISNQIFMDVYVKNRTTRPMPLYSIPGLIDHH